ncbi:MAG: hypothetical protein OXQ29_16335 [Rhodospirillaceae bacterium]|nr:hypothetical protein [Rhodospirillaceae bacterium]
MNIASTVISVQIIEEEGVLFTRSTDLPGLRLCSRDMNSLLADIPDAIKLLYRENKGVAVDVRPTVPVNVFPAPPPSIEIAKVDTTYLTPRPSLFVVDNPEPLSAVV